MFLAAHPEKQKINLTHLYLYKNHFQGLIILKVILKKILIWKVNLEIEI